MADHARTDIRSARIAARPDREPISHIVVIGNALPRRCGLATFTSHVVDALGARFPALRVDHYAMDDGTGVAYPGAIRTIAADDPAAYRAAAGLIEASGAQAIWVQHEYGIFGGEAGSHLFLLLDRTTLPVVTTLHTVLENPTAAERIVFERLLRRSSQLIVMAERGRAILRDIYGVADDRISVIPHGVPDRLYLQPDEAKDRFGLAGRRIVMTFGLLAPDKGIAHMIEAMPSIAAVHPDCLYLVVGATHPNLVREQGEAHRDSLAALAEQLGVSDHVRFIDAFLEQDELLDWLEACDVYVTPYLNLAQITSGTLSYAVALGKPVVSTPYLHATEILADGHGILVPPRDSAALAEAVGTLLTDSGQRETIAQRAYLRGRGLLWPRHVERAMDLMERAPETPVRQLPGFATALPLPASLDAVGRMTDSTGILQHGIYSVPDRNHGYCTDDNARGLILACRIDGDTETADRIAGTYAAFIQHAWNPDRIRFRNFMRYDRSWCEEEGSEDSNGRALWALGCATAHGRDRAMRDWAIHLFDQAAPLAEALQSPRSLAFASLGAADVLSVVPGHKAAREIIEDASTMLLQRLQATRQPGWTWFEAVLAYDNARLPETLIRAGMALGEQAFIHAGLETLAWVMEAQTGSGGAFRPVGTDSFGREYTAPLPFDQQPLEAQASVEACAAAWEATGDTRWIEAAQRAYGWFAGLNDLGQPLVSRRDGGCFDGLMPHGLNRNQGAESILALQLANVAIASISGKLGATRSRDAA